MRVRLCCVVLCIQSVMMLFCFVVFGYIIHYVYSICYVNGKSLTLRSCLSATFKLDHLKSIHIQKLWNVSDVWSWEIEFCERMTKCGSSNCVIWSWRKIHCVRLFRYFGIKPNTDNNFYCVQFLWCAFD